MIRKTSHFQYESPYYLSHEPTETPRELWVIFHGYGQQAQYFLRKFLPFAEKDRLFIAPEGTNQFYLQDFQGRIGANWMTRHERELAIANTHRFLEAVLDVHLERFAFQPEFHVLGFSQGAATATRWAGQWPHRLSSLTLWAGGFAEDLQLDLAKKQFQQTHIRVVLGKEDTIISPESLLRQEALISQLGLPVQRLEFDGGHQLEPKVLEHLFRKP